MSKNSEPVTREDLEEILGEVVSEILGAVSAQFEHVNNKLDTQGNAINRVENILRPTVDKVDDHEVRLKLLEASTA